MNKKIFFPVSVVVLLMPSVLYSNIDGTNANTREEYNYKIEEVNIVKKTFCKSGFKNDPSKSESIEESKWNPIDFDDLVGSSDVIVIGYFGKKINSGNKEFCELKVAKTIKGENVPLYIKVEEYSKNARYEPLKMGTYYMLFLRKNENSDSYKIFHPYSYFVSYEKLTSFVNNNFLDEDVYFNDKNKDYRSISVKDVYDSMSKKSFSTYEDKEKGINNFGNRRTRDT